MAKLTESASPKSRNRAIALSAVFGGLGQIYLGQVKKGILLIALSIVGLIAFILPGVTVIVLGMVDAGIMAKRLLVHQTIRDWEFFWNVHATQPRAYPMVSKTRAPGTKSVRRATALSLIFGGGGQIYLGQVKKGVLLIALSVVGLVALVVPGVIVIIVSMIDANIIAKRFRRMDRSRIGSSFGVLRRRAHGKLLTWFRWATPRSSWELNHDDFITLNQQPFLIRHSEQEESGLSHTHLSMKGPTAQPV